MTDNVSISWEIRGVDAFERRLRQMARRAEFPEPVLAKIGEQWIGWIEEQFETQGVRFLGHKWAKLSPYTISRRKATGPILIDKADLLLAVTDPSNVRVTPGQVTLHIPAEQERIGGFHQTGTGSRSGHTFTGGRSNEMPARPILAFGESDRRSMYADIKDWLFEETGRWMNN